MARPSPLFISGVPGSGATWLADQLGVSAHYAPAYDADFVARLLWVNQIYRGQKRADAIARAMSDAVNYAQAKPTSLNSSFHHGPRHLNLDPTWLAPRTAELIRQLDSGFGAFAMREFLTDVLGRHAEADGRKRWAVKSPVLTHVLPQLLAVFPKMRFIHVIREREGAGVRLDGPLYETDRAQAARFANSHPHQYARIRWEDLQTQMPGVIAGVVKWAGDSPKRLPLFSKAA